MLRKLGLGFTALAMMTPAMAVALGVGEYELNSYLNQPLDMEVSLHEVGDLSEEEILVNLASQSEFDAAGVERGYFLNRLTFSVEKSGGDEAILRVTTDQPVREPYLNFLVEFLWPTGRLMREYTVLLDPPSFTDTSTTAAPTVSRAPVPVASSQPEPTPAPAPAPSAEPSTVTTSAPAPAASSGPRDTYTVQPSDTMWRVALNTRPADSVSVQQMLVAIQDMNPEAFIDGNVNLVREGTVLRIPNEQEVRSVSTRNALVTVADQNRKWRDMLEERGIQVAPQQRAQLDGSREVADSEGDAQGENTGQVKLVAPESTDSVADGDSTGSAREGSANTAVLENELAIRDENLDRLDRENAELKSRLQDLQSQNDTSEQLLKLRNDQIAQLQDELRQLREQQGVEVSEDDPLMAVPETVETAVEAGSQDSDGAADESGAQDMADTNGDAASNEIAGDEIVDGSPATSEEVAEDTAVEQGESAQSDVAAEQETASSEPAVAEVTKAPEVAKPEPAETEQPQASATNNIVQMLMDNLMYIALGALVIVLLVFLLLRRNKKDDEAGEEGALFDEFDDESQDDFGLNLEDEYDGAGETQDVADEDDGHAPQDSNLDPIENVELYVAYGQYPQAIDFLRNEINKHPERDDLKVRLLELLKETNDDNGFQQQATAYAGISGPVDEAIARLNGGEVAAPAASDDEELSLDDLEMGLSSELDEQSIPTMEADNDTAEEAPQSEARSDVADELEDFDFELDGADELDGDETLLLDEADSEEVTQSAEASSEQDAGDDGMSDADRQSLEASPVLNLDDVSSASFEDDDTNYGELDLEDMSAEFTDIGDESSSSSEELDLSLDDLDLDDDTDTEAAGTGGDDTLTDLDLDLDEADKALDSAPQSDSLDDITAFDLDEDKGEALTSKAQDDEPSLEDLVSDDDLELDGDLDTTAATQESGDSGDDTLDLDSLMEETPAEPAPAQSQDVAQSAPTEEPEAQPAPAADAGEDLLSDEDDFDFLGETDENATKLDLAKAYIDMGDAEGAKDILNEVISEGNDQQQAEARELMGQVG